MSDTIWIILGLVIGIILAIVILLLVLRNTGAKQGNTCTAATGQCTSGTFCNSDGFCISGTGKGVGVTCATTSECIYGLDCITGTCQSPLLNLVPMPAGNSNTTPTPTTPTNNTQTPVNNSPSSTDQFLTTSTGKLSVLSNNQLTLSNPIPSQKVTDIQNFISNGVKPSYISSANSFSKQSIYINTSAGKYYLQIGSGGSYWINEQFMNTANDVKFTYDKTTNTLSVDSKKIYIVAGSQSSQIKFSANKYYLRTSPTSVDSTIIIERSSDGYYIRSANGMYLTMDMTGATVTYAKFPAILTTLDQLNTSVKLVYINIGVYLKK